MTTTPLIIIIITILFNTILSFLPNYEHHTYLLFTGCTSTNYTSSSGASETNNSLSPCECEYHNMVTSSQILILIYIWSSYWHMNLMLDTMATLRGGWISVWEILNFLPYLSQSEHINHCVINYILKFIMIHKHNIT